MLQHIVFNVAKNKERAEFEKVVSQLEDIDMMGNAEIYPKVRYSSY